MKYKNVLYFTIWCILLPIISGQNISDFLDRCKLSVQMFDASAKIPSGILTGNTIAYGSFDQCLSIKYEANDIEIKGKYCIMQFKIEFAAVANNSRIISANRNANMGLAQLPSLTLGWCIPHHCPVEYFHQNIAIDILNSQINATIEPLQGNGLCQTEDDIEYISKLSAGEWTAVAFFIIALVLTILSTIYDMYLQHYKKKSLHIILIAFSIRTNGEKLLQVSNNPNQLPCLNGIRFLSIMWVILGHRQTMMITYPNINTMDAYNWALSVFNMYIINATLSVDTFFVLSGLLVSYVFFLAQQKGVKFNIFLFYIHRYLRLTPVLAVIVLFTVTLLKYMGTGPNWSETIASTENDCKDYWWSTLIYIANYNNPNNICLGVTWYLAIDFQLYLLSPLLLLPLAKWPKITLGISTILILASMVISFVVSVHYDMPAFQGFNPEYHPKYYVATHTRYGPWLIGLILGYFIFKLKNDKNFQLKLNPLVVILGWITALLIMATCLFASHDLLMSSDWTEHAFLNALNRHGWSLGVCWVIFACIHGYGGPINAFLSWGAFQVLGRLTYTLYLSHQILQMIVFGRLRTNTYFDDFVTWYIYFGDIAFSLIIAIYLTLSFESPMLTIEKILFKTGHKKKEPELPIHQSLDKNEQKL